MDMILPMDHGWLQCSFHCWWFPWELLYKWHGRCTTRLVWQRLSIITWRFRLQSWIQHLVSMIGRWRWTAWTIWFGWDSARFKFSPRLCFIYPLWIDWDWWLRKIQRTHRWVKQVHASTGTSKPGCVECDGWWQVSSNGLSSCSWNPSTCRQHWQSCYNHGRQCGRGVRDGSRWEWGKNSNQRTFATEVAQAVERVPCKRRVQGCSSCATVSHQDSGHQSRCKFGSPCFSPTSGEHCQRFACAFRKIYNAFPINNGGRASRVHQRIWSPTWSFIDKIQGVAWSIYTKGDLLQFTLENRKSHSQGNKFGWVFNKICWKLAQIAGGKFAELKDRKFRRRAKSWRHHSLHTFHRVSTWKPCEFMHDSDLFPPGPAAQNRVPKSWHSW